MCQYWTQYKEDKADFVIASVGQRAFDGCMGHREQEATVGNEPCAVQVQFVADMLEVDIAVGIQRDPEDADSVDWTVYFGSGIQGDRSANGCIALYQHNFPNGKYAFSLVLEAVEVTTQ